MVVRVLPDANVLHSRTLRDWLFLLQLQGATSGGEAFHTYYTVDILSETIATIRRRRPDLDGAAMTAISDRIAGSMSERIVVYPAVPDVPLADAKDRHVHAAAVAAGIHILVTADSGFVNLDGQIKDELPYEVLTPDQFLVLADDSWPDLVHQVTRLQQEYWTGRGLTNVPKALVRAQCEAFADRVRAHLQDY